MEGGGVRVSVVPGPIFRGVGIGLGARIYLLPLPEAVGTHPTRMLSCCIYIASGSSFFVRIYLTGIPVTMGNLLHVKEFVQMGRNVIS